MKSRIFPKESSNFKSEFDFNQLIEILKENTLDGSLSSTAYNTSKKFIGSVEERSFKIISSSNRTSMFCIFEGQLLNESKEILIIKKFHPTFRNLFIFWAIAMLSILIFLPGRSNPVVSLIMFFAFVLFLRYLLITVLYRKSLEEGMEKLTDTLKLTEKC
ncbi:hypothetical protein [Flavobacterium phycosphaerae]|uniref:hypothetical protein n=1 Tax=Flavobacterium phycosphaerae TaxID=2697515 RepID=UPI00138A01DB|nr:hypothetical protein [Flavobacterium phycosphaerae]